ncbi:Corticotropin-releasing factor receptor 2 [Lamellibrachia satsuma]|nr:Corticotropin-releasing factor receptor 2 [Lamellibrachia satsuma]
MIVSPPGGNKITRTATTQDGEGIFCNSTFDMVTCWPRTPAGQLVTLPCPKQVNGVSIHPNGNVTRLCIANGTWMPRSDYSLCSPIMLQPYGEMEITHNTITRTIYNVGFSVSTAALVAALCIFVYFRNLRCVRNTIHCHLIVTFILRNILWLILNSVLQTLTEQQENETHQWICKMLVLLFNYLQMTNFFWMLVEGLYLHTLIVWAYTTERIKFWFYALIGWGVPAVIIGVWAIVMATVQSDVSCWMPMDNSFYDYIYISPILAVLLVNLIFLGSIVYVLITKLRASNILQIKQSRKAVKATLILFPLLGATYLIFITHTGGDLVSRKVFTYFNAFMQATQGLAVAVFYCFLNEEVRSTIRMKVNRWQDGRSVATRYTRASTTTNLEQISLARGSVNLNCSPLIAINGKCPKDYAKNNNENYNKSAEMIMLTNR